MAYTPELLLQNPTPGDPAVRNAWGTIENTGRSLVDSAISGVLSLSVAGSANVVLTSNQGAADQARNQHFVFTGILTGNIYVLWPNGLTRFFSVENNTTGAFTLSAAVNNGSSLPAGTSVSVPQGTTVMLYSNGANVAVRALGGSGTASNFSIGGNLSVTGTSALTGAVTLSSTLNTAGKVTVVPAVNTNALAVTGYSLTGPNTQSLIDLAGTWNTVGAPIAIKLNLTDTTSDSSSRLLDLQIASATKFYVRKDGSIFTSKGILGTTTNDNAQPQYVGYYLQSQILLGSAISLTSNVSANITSIALEAGDYDVWANVWSAPSGATVTQIFEACISTVSATMTTAPDGGGYNRWAGSVTATAVSVFVQKRVSLAAPATIYLVSTGTFSSTLSAYGSIQYRVRR